MADDAVALSLLVPGVSRQQGTKHTPCGGHEGFFCQLISIQNVFESRHSEYVAC